MSNIATPTVNFTPEFLAFAKAAIALNDAQLGNAAAAPAVQSAPIVETKPAVKPLPECVVKPAGEPFHTDAPYGYKADGTPRKRPVPTWLNNVKSDAAPTKPRKSKPVVEPTIVLPTKADEPKWKSEAAVNGSEQHIRIIAAELVVFGVKSRKLSLDISGLTKGQASERYQSLAPRVKSKGADIRNKSANWKLAAAIIEKMPIK